MANYHRRLRTLISDKVLPRRRDEDNTVHAYLYKAVG
jgi:hypothetical protein